MDVETPDDDLGSTIAEGLHVYAARRVPSDHPATPFVATEPAERKRAVRLIPILSAAAAVVLVAVGGVLLTHQPSRQTAAPPLGSGPASTVGIGSAPRTSPTKTAAPARTRTRSIATTTPSVSRSATTTSASPPTSRSTIATHLPLDPANVVITQADNGETVILHRGQQLIVTLGDNQAGGRYWQIDSAQPASVLASLPQAANPAPGTQPGCNIPGVLCGTVTRAFQPVADGTASVTASRSSCGEAMGCLPSQGSFAITVKVTG